MMTLKLSIIASRAELSQHTWWRCRDQQRVDAAAAQIGLDVGRALDEGGKPLLHDLRVLRPGVELAPQRVSLLSELHAGVARSRRSGVCSQSCSTLQLSRVPDVVS